MNLCFAHAASSNDCNVMQSCCQALPFIKAGTVSGTDTPGLLFRLLGQSLKPGRPLRPPGELRTGQVSEPPAPQLLTPLAFRPLCRGPLLCRHILGVYFGLLPAHLDCAETACNTVALCCTCCIGWNAIHASPLLFCPCLVCESPSTDKHSASALLTASLSNCQDLLISVFNCLPAHVCLGE